jgi:hypothetical protein
MYSYLKITKNANVKLTNITTQDGTSYYFYPMSLGAPAVPSTNNGAFYFIPISGTVHTHNQCMTTGTSGVEAGAVSDDDASFCLSHQNLVNYVLAAILLE